MVNVLDQHLGFAAKDDPARSEGLCLLVPRVPLALLPLSLEDARVFESSDEQGRGKNAEDYAGGNVREYHPNAAQPVYHNGRDDDDRDGDNGPRDKGHWPARPPEPQRLPFFGLATDVHLPNFSFVAAARGRHVHGHIGVVVRLGRVMVRVKLVVLLWRRRRCFQDRTAVFLFCQAFSVVRRGGGRKRLRAHGGCHDGSLDFLLAHALQRGRVLHPDGHAERGVDELLYNSTVQDTGNRAYGPRRKGVRSVHAATIKREREREGGRERRKKI